jgi:hypothetical protein
MEDPGSNPGRGKKTATEQKYLKVTTLGSEPAYIGTTVRYSTTAPHFSWKIDIKTKYIIQADHLSPTSQNVYSFLIRYFKIFTWTKGF